MMLSAKITKYEYYPKKQEGHYETNTKILTAFKNAVPI